MVDFLGIGAQKAGTTWLFHQLSKHPQIAFPAGKELHFWDLGDPRRADDWCRRLEPETRRLPDGRPVRSGEITPAYAILPRDRIEAIRLQCPDVRLFISLRNPIERAWSAAVMEARRGGRPEDGRSMAWFLEQACSAESIARGDYAGCLERWWAVFPRERLLVLFHDEIGSKPADVLARLARHLDVDEADLSRVPAADLAEVVVPELDGGDNGLPVGPMPGDLFAPLRKLYEPLVRRLAGLVDRDLEDWLRPPTDAPAGRSPRRAVIPAARAAKTVAELAAHNPPEVR